MPASLPDPALVELLMSPGPRILAFVLGATWGSFLNVVIYRLPLGMSLSRPRSRCSSCEAPIAWYDNVPILSYLALRGRCRRCGAQYGARYMLIELLCGAIGLTLWMRYVHVPWLMGHAGAPWAALVWFVVALCLVAIAWIDIDWWIIPNAIVRPLWAIGVALAVVAPEILDVAWPEAVGASFAAYALFWGLSTYYRRVRGIEALGMGDAKLVAMFAAFSGAAGALWVIVGGALQGLLIGVPVMMSGRSIATRSAQEAHGGAEELAEAEDEAVMQRRLPFGPFLALAALEWIVLRRELEGALAWLMGAGDL